MCLHPVCYFISPYLLLAAAAPSGRYGWSRGIERWRNLLKLNSRRGRAGVGWEPRACAPCPVSHPSCPVYCICSAGSPLWCLSLWHKRQWLWGTGGWTGYFFKNVFYWFSQFSSVAQSCPTLCDPMDCSKPDFLVHHQLLESLLKLMSIELVMLSNHLILCCPLLFLPSIFTSIRVFFKESVLCIRRWRYWSLSFSIGPSNEYSGLISFRFD